MSVFRQFGLVVAVACGLSGVSVARAAEDMSEPTHAQPELAREDLTITSGGTPHHFSVELAKTPRQQQVGEMFRTSLAADRGMLFIWPYSQQSDMWMEHTLVSLDIVFIGADHKINAITENAVPQSLAHISSHGPVIATLELAAGVTAKLGITVGDLVQSPSLVAKH